ncbi:MAG: 50S ribosomal protein L19e [Candidatus Altiarchaeota archaeon]
MNLSLQRKLAAKILKVGINRIYISPEKKEEVSKAITRDDIRALIKDGLISVRKEKGTSRVRVRKIKEQKRKGRRKGHGSRKGKKGARTPRKEIWISKVRALRDELKKLKKEGKIDRKEYRKLYRQIKGNIFKSRRHLRESLSAK